MRSLNLVKDSHFTLIKCYSTLRSIQNVVSDVESPYVMPGKELSQAQALLHSDFSACSRHLKKALNLYQQEVPLARRYNTVRDRIISAENRELSMKNSQFVEAIRAGKYRDAGKLLDEMLKMDIPQIENHLSAIISQDGTRLVLLNSSSTHINVVSVSVQSGDNVYGGGFRGNILPGKSAEVPFSGKLAEPLEVHVVYFVSGKQFKRNLRLGA